MIGEKNEETNQLEETMLTAVKVKQMTSISCKCFVKGVIALIYKEIVQIINIGSQQIKRQKTLDNLF